MRIGRFCGIVLKNVMRNKRRTIVTVCGLTIALSVITVLLSVNHAFHDIIYSSGKLNFTVYEKNRACPLSSRIPDKYKNGIREMMGVKNLTSVLSTILHYKNLETFIYLSGIEPETYLLSKDLHVIDVGFSQFAESSDRNAALVGRAIAKKFGWKRNDSINLLENNITFIIKGIFESNDLLLEGYVLLKKDYLADAIGSQGKTTYMLGNLQEGTDLKTVARAIDGNYANFPTATKTQSEQAAKATLMEDFEGLRQFMLAMVVATIIAMLSGTANTISMSVRERTREIAVLRTLGFRKPFIINMIVTESVLISLIGGCIGISMAVLFLATGPSLLGFLSLRPTMGIVLIGAGLSLLVGFLGGLTPAVLSSRTNIVKALRAIE